MIEEEIEVLKGQVEKLEASNNQIIIDLEELRKSKQDRLAPRSTFKPKRRY